MATDDRHVRLPAELNRVLPVAAASVNLSVNEFICASTTAAVETLAEADPLFAAALRYMSERSRSVVINPERFHREAVAKSAGLDK